MTVPFLDARASYLELRGELDAAWHRVMQGGWYILGEEVEAFEREFAAYCGTRDCAGTGNGLDALHLILRGYGIGAGDDVIVPAHTFIATWLAVTNAGANPIPVDCDPSTLQLDPARLASAITPRTRAVIVTHLYGHPADVDAIASTCRERNLKLIEDAAQAHGALYKGRRAGSLGHAAAFSFYPAKNLGAFGDGGAVVSNDAALIERIRLQRNYGSRVKYSHETPGVNSRLDPLQAAVLRAKLPHLEEWNARRRSIAARYLRELAGIPDLRLPAVADYADPSWHLFAVRSTRRDSLRQFLADAGVETMIHYPVPPHLSGAYAGTVPGEFPVAEHAADTILSLPIGPHLKDDDVSIVIQHVHRFFARNA
ncbi:MAG TPA: DegT/DnrJ/EryC1/StrS family aminotransferase [Bryobacteraceae bacterium]|nr:DegT/DnrJ/EryC1/StrS family aminotransferase [Bryobacteraceae bacterium]